ncbi:MAG: sel1 repeat family protein [Proteobacteria bacterium]|nr:sel1 repeat family protein [Pseudomonadota bacterium]MBU1594394.1 sel1 repeat family protein [Pseudomonadota bacterium]
MPQIFPRLMTSCLLALLLFSGCSASPEAHPAAPLPPKTKDQLIVQKYAAFLTAEQQGEWAKARAILTELAESGHAYSQSRLGLRLLSGRQYTQDLPGALHWLTRASELGSARAQNGLASMYANGRGVPRNHEIAFRYYSMAARGGDADGCYNLGNCYGSGRGTAPDLAEAIRWHRRGAELGGKWAQASLAKCYLKGLGVERDYRQAFQWATLAVTAWNLDAVQTQSSAAANLTPQQLREAHDFVSQWRPLKP